MIDTSAKEFIELVLDNQCKFQLEIGNDITSQRFKNDTALALCAEVYEALGETPWKHWKKNQNLNAEKFKDEVVDIFLFVINMILSSNMSQDEFVCKTFQKMNINWERLKQSKNKGEKND